MGVLDDHLEQRRTAEVIGQGECLRLGQPHQGRLDGEAAIQSKGQGNLLRLQRVVAAVRIAGIIGLTHATHQNPQVAAIGQSARRVKNNKFRPGTKVFGSPASFISMVISSVMADPPSWRRTLASSRWSAPSHPPVGKPIGQRGTKGVATLQLDPMTLTVIEADRLHPVKLRQRPDQTGGRILSAGKQDQCAVEMSSHVVCVRRQIYVVSKSALIWGKSRICATDKSGWPR